MMSLAHKGPLTGTVPMLACGTDCPPLRNEAVAEAASAVQNTGTVTYNGRSFKDFRVERTSTYIECVLLTIVSDSS